MQIPFDVFRERVIANHPASAAVDRLKQTVDPDFVPASPEAILENDAYQRGWFDGWQWARDVATARELSDLEAAPLSGLERVKNNYFERQAGLLDGALAVWHEVKNEVLNGV